MPLCMISETRGMEGKFYRSLELSFFHNTLLSCQLLCFGDFVAFNQKSDSNIVIKKITIDSLWERDTTNYFFFILNFYI